MTGSILNLLILADVNLHSTHTRRTEAKITASYNNMENISDFSERPHWKVGCKAIERWEIGYQSEGICGSLLDGIHSVVVMLSTCCSHEQ